MPLAVLSALAPGRVEAGPDGAAETGPRLTVDAVGCAALQASEVGRILQLELEVELGGELAAPARAAAVLRVHIDCDAARSHIRVTDAVTTKSIERTLSAPEPTDPARDRVVALAAAELVLSSWAELLVPDRRIPLPPPPPPAAALVAPARTAAARVLTGNGGGRLMAGWSADLVGTGRVRDLAGTARGSWAVTLRLGFPAGGAWRALAAASYEHTGADTNLGRIAADLGTLSAGLGRRGRGARVSWSAAAFASVLAASITGQPGSTATGSNVAAIAGELSLSGGPELRGRTLAVGIEAQTGWTWPGITGRDATGGAVRLGGPWAGIGVRLTLGSPEAAP